MLRAVSVHCCCFLPACASGEHVRGVSPCVGIGENMIHSSMLTDICHLTASLASKTPPPPVTLLNFKALSPHSEIQT